MVTASNGVFFGFPRCVFLQEDDLESLKLKLLPGEVGFAMCDPPKMVWRSREGQFYSTNMEKAE